MNAIDKAIDLDDLSEFLSTQGNTLKKLKIGTIFQRLSNLNSMQSDTAVYRGIKNRGRKFYKLKLKNMIALTCLSFCIDDDAICPQTVNALENLPNLV